MTLVEHVRELRRRLGISLLAILVATAVAFFFHERMLHTLTGPYCDLPPSYRLVHDRCSLVVTGVLDAFTVTLRLSMYAGLVVASPVWLYQIWRFVTPGLYRNERRWALSFVASSLVLFAAGGVFAWLTLSRGLHFLLSFATGGISSLLSFNSYLSYVVAMVLVFGVSFELPLLIVLLNLAGIVSYEKLRGWWRGSVFGIFVFAAFVTPSQDPFTMSAMALPMSLLYFVALFIARWHDKRAARRAAASPYAHLADDELSPLDDEDEPAATH
jgi:sec-independent protein translocase protein TatC